MKIDWDKANATWRVYNLNGTLLYSAKHIVIEKGVELVADADNHGWAVTHGNLELVGETLFIR